MKALVFSVLFFSVIQLNGQDILFNRGYAMPLQTNPAFAGSGLCKFGPAARFNSLYYMNEKKNELLLGLGFDRIISPIGGGVGIHFFSDNQGNGLVKLNVVKATYSYILPLNKFKYAIQIGFQPGLEQKSMNPDQRTFLPKIENYFALPDSLANDIKHSTYFTLGSGIIFRNYKYATRPFTFGFSWQNLNRPDWSFSGQNKIRKPILFCIHGDYQIFKKRDRRDLYDKFAIFINGMYRHQNTCSDMMFGVQELRQKAIFGIGYRKYSGLNEVRNILQGNFGYKWRSLTFTYNMDYALTDKTHNSYFMHLFTIKVEWCIPPGMRPGDHFIGTPAF